MTELSQRKIPFVISRLSILDHPLVKDLLAYFRLIAKPFDDIARSRAGGPGLAMEPAGLVRHAERARKEQEDLYDVLQIKQAAAVRSVGQRWNGAAEFLSEQRKTMHRRTARKFWRTCSNGWNSPRSRAQDRNT